MLNKNRQDPSAPHLYSPQSQASLTVGMILALSPAVFWGFAAFGSPAALTIAAAILSALAFEALFSALRRDFTLRDGSAFLTGLIIGLSLPPGAPLFVPIAASAFAIVVVKWSFGGLGANWMNPAMAGIALAYLAWPGAMEGWLVPRGMVNIQGLSTSTPIATLSAAGAASFAGSGIFVTSSADTFFTGILNDGLFGSLGVSLPPGYMDLFSGNRPGAIGEISILLLLAGSLWIIAKRIIRVEIPVAILGSFALLSWIFGSLPGQLSLFSGDALFSLFTGSIVFTAFFPACDPVTSPIRRPGRIVYGLLIGTLCWAFRKAGAMGEGAAFAVIITNCLVPAIDGLGRERG